MANENQDEEKKESAEAFDSAVKESLTRGLREKLGDEGARGRVMDSAGSRRKSVWSAGLGGVLGRVKRREVFAFCEELALLLEYGMPLVNGLNTLANRVDNPAFARVIMDMGVTVEQGGSFTEAASKQARHFPDLVINMFRAGERSGTLMETLHRVADQGERLAAARHRAVTSLIYPVFIILVAMGVVSFAFSYVMEVFEKQLLEPMGLEPFWMMKILLSLGKLWQSGTFWIITVAIIAGVVVFYLFARRFSGFRLLRDRFYVRCPFVRRFVKEGTVARFSRVFGTMLEAGVPLDETLQAVHDTSSNELVRHTLTRVQEAVAAGGRITPVLERSDMFPPVAYDLMAIGEEAGALDRVFSRMADIYEEKLATDVAALAKFVQPVIVIVLGLIVGFIVVAMFGTYSSLLQQIQI